MDKSKGKDAANQPSQRRQTSSREAKAFPRKRALAACRVCRARKIKCNNARPSCSSCTMTGASCVYEDYHDISKFDSASLVIIERLDQIMTSLSQLQQASSSVQVPSQITHGPVQYQGATLDPSSSFLEPSISSLKIPSSEVGPDPILVWPIFQGQFTPDLLIREVALIAKEGHTGATLAFVDEPDIENGRVFNLIERFLEYVHSKNPVLDIAFLRRSSQAVAERGLDWDGPSCLVLLACALGSLSGPFTSDQDSAQGSTPSSSHNPQMELSHNAEIYYQAALKRLGLLANGLLSAQCWFFSGVYQMYKLRPFPAWSYFSHASSLLHLHISGTYLQHGALERPELTPEEVCLYWSCWKSECDLRAELPLPNSVLSDTTVVDMYPTPPQSEFDSTLNGFSVSVPAQRLSSSTRQDPGFKQTQEMVWYYYLSDVTLKRLQAQILNSLYQARWDPPQLPHMIRIVVEFEARVDAWLKSLPVPIQFEEWDPAPRHEVVYNLQARVFQVKLWLYKPFIYYAIHHSLGRGTAQNIEEYVHKAIACCLHVIQSKNSRHRHHGTWFTCRTLLGAAILIIAAVKAGGIIDYLVDWQDLVNQVIVSLEYWESESRDIARGISVLEDLLSQLQEEQDQMMEGSESG